MRKINVRFLDVLGSRGGYNYINSGMMYSTSCWNYITDCHKTGVMIKKEKKIERMWQSGTISPKHTEKDWKAVPDDISCCKAHVLSFLIFLCEEEI